MGPGVVAGSLDTREVALLFCKSHLNQSKWFPKVADAVVNVVWRVKLGQDLQEILKHFQLTYILHILLLGKLLTLKTLLSESKLV